MEGGDDSIPFTKYSRYVVLQCRSPGRELEVRRCFLLSATDFSSLATLGRITPKTR